MPKVGIGVTKASALPLAWLLLSVNSYLEARCNIREALQRAVKLKVADERAESLNLRIRENPGECRLNFENILRGLTVIGLKERLELFERADNTRWVTSG